MNSILKYNQAKMRIFQLIADQHLKIGDRLPPERDLVENFELSLITVRRAMHELEEENIIERRPRMGTYLKQSIAQIPELGRILYLKIYKTEYGENIFLDTMVQEVEFQLKKEHIRLLYHSAVSPSVEIAEAAAECLGIFVTGWLDVKWRDFLKSLGLPVMVIGSNPYPDVFSTVSYDMRTAAELCHHALLEQGCARTALVNGGPTYLPALEIHRGFMKAAKSHGLKPASVPVLWSGQSGIRIYLTDFLREHPDLDGILLESGEFDAILGCLWQMGYRRDLRLAVIVDNVNVIRPFSTVPGGFAAYFEQSIPVLAVKRMLRNTSCEGQRITKDLIQPVLYYQ